jgi:hypothetical protein
MILMERRLADRNAQAQYLPFVCQNGREAHGQPHEAIFDPTKAYLNSSSILFLMYEKR